ncbi:MAG: hypothetical protein IAF38_06425, partial [Bacteroidia bacterium]|nr:hypothetical protein [Bacteroidia bacterium]
MKKTGKTLALFFLLFQFFLVQAQNKKLRIVTKVSPGSFVYMGFDNPINISVEGLKSENLYITLKGGGATIILVADSSYVLRATSAKGDSLVINVSERKNGKNVLVGKKAFKIKPVPMPYVKFANKGSGETISKAALLTTNYLLVGMDWDVTTGKSIIGSFTVEINGKKLSAPSGKITDEMKDAFKKENPKKIKFTYVKALSPEGVTVTLPDTVFRVGG